MFFMVQQEGAYDDPISNAQILVQIKSHVATLVQLQWLKCTAVLHLQKFLVHDLLALYKMEVLVDSQDTYSCCFLYAAQNLI